MLARSGELGERRLLAEQHQQVAFMYRLPLFDGDACHHTACGCLYGLTVAVHHHGSGGNNTFIQRCQCRPEQERSQTCQQHYPAKADKRNDVNKGRLLRIAIMHGLFLVQQGRCVSYLPGELTAVRVVPLGHKAWFFRLRGRADGWSAAIFPDDEK